MLKLKDIMSTNLATVSPHTSLRDAAALLARQHVSGVPVLSDRGIVGMLSASDIVAFASCSSDSTAELLALVGEPADDLRPSVTPMLEEHTVDEAMTRKLWALDAEADVASAAQLMARSRVHRVVVIADGKLAGIVTTSDVTRALADGLTK